MFDTIKARLIRVIKILTCHRAFYAALGLCHVNGCWMTDYPLLYAPMAFLYAGLALRG